MKRVVEISGLRKSFAPPGRPRFDALIDVDLELFAGQCLGLIGESGSGKSTLIKCLARMIEPDAGEIRVNGLDWHRLDARDWRRHRRAVQLVFQDAAAAFDPRMTIGMSLLSALAEPRPAAVAAMLERVGLGEALARRLPHQLSGGQLQRANIARALLAEPQVLLLDEPISALDPPAQRQVLDLLAELRQQGLALLLVGHDLETIARAADQVAVMYLSRIVESGATALVLERPRHPYTAALRAAAARHGLDQQIRVLLKGEIPAPWQPPLGCAFHPRCPQARDLCRRERPLLTPQGGSEVACFFPQGTAEE